MASRRSRSLSTPSEGEIIESGSEAKATTSQTPLNGTKIDRHTRASPSSASRSPTSLSSRSPLRPRKSRSRTRSRSPYREYRGSKRTRDDDYDDRRFRREPPPPRRFGPKYNGSYDDRRGYRGRPGSYYDYDREDSYASTLHYNDDYSRHREKRPRTRSRSPVREVRKPRRYSGDESDSKRERSVSRDMRRQTTEQSVSGRVNSSVAAQASRRDAETRENQVRQSSADAASPGVDRYVPFLSF